VILSFRPRLLLLWLVIVAAWPAIAGEGGQRRGEQGAGGEEVQATDEAAQPAGVAPDRTAATEVDIIAELEGLARLHESGALSDEEFAAAKAHLLGVDDDLGAG
jgi:Short C-terminal domain